MIPSPCKGEGKGVGRAPIFPLLGAHRKWARARAWVANPLSPCGRGFRVRGPSRLSTESEVRGRIPSPSMGEDARRAGEGA